MPDASLPRAITREIAAYAVETRYDALPERVQVETMRAFLNWVGCALGGCREAAAVNAVEAVKGTGGAPQATLIGYHERSDVASAAFVNCLSSSALAYDDTHLATVTHPTGPVAAALLGHAERETVSGEEFLNALALGMEIECRLSNVLLRPPARANLALYVTGLTGPIGAAVALGRVMGFDEQRMRWAIGLAATQAAGFRATHGSTAGIVVPAFGARTGVFAAHLAASGIDCSENALEAAKGFVDIFSTGANFDYAVEGLGTQFELLANANKPYPAGIVVHAAIDACQEVARQLPSGAELAAVRLTVHPLALTLADRRRPTTPLEAQVSLYHWVAAVFLRGSAGIGELRQEVIDDPDIGALRNRIEATADPDLGRDEAIAEVVLSGGETLRAHVRNARGSLARPMTDEELDAKFRMQAEMVLPEERSEQLLQLLRRIAREGDAGRVVSALLEGTNSA